MHDPLCGTQSTINRHDDNEESYEAYANEYILPSERFPYARYFPSNSARVQLLTTRDDTDTNIRSTTYTTSKSEYHPFLAIWSTINRHDDNKEPYEAYANASFGLSQSERLPLYTSFTTRCFLEYNF